MEATTTNDEAPERLEPKVATKRWLYLLSGNQCAFSPCDEPLINDHGDWIGEIVHITAAMPGGERFDPSMTNEERRQFDNLLLMCHPHHIETNDVEAFPVSRMKEIKHEHEAKFHKGMRAYIHAPLPDDFFDHTSAQAVRPATNLKRLEAHTTGYVQGDDESDSWTLRSVNELLTRLQSLTPRARALLGIIIDRGDPNRIGTSTTFGLPRRELIDVVNRPAEEVDAVLGQLDRVGYVLVSDGETPGEWVYTTDRIFPEWNFLIDLKVFLADIEGGARSVRDIFAELDLSVLSAD